MCPGLSLHNKSHLMKLATSSTRPCCRQCISLGNISWRQPILRVYISPIRIYLLRVCRALYWTCPPPAVPLPEGLGRTWPEHHHHQVNGALAARWDPEWFSKLSAISASPHSLHPFCVSTSSAPFQGKDANSNLSEKPEALIPKQTLDLLHQVMSLFGA